MDLEEAIPILERKPEVRYLLCHDLWNAFWNTRKLMNKCWFDEEKEEIICTEDMYYQDTEEAKRIKDIAKMLGCEWAKYNYVRPEMRKIKKIYSLRDEKK